ncbi:lytic polysaccharide monooxygenase [Glycomyces sp. A-F 0318]|uniref:lytic polysaccharide monooxygenase auxiliary activity family 9 protein n=1 Tax=Glycomyces amatae TaxID=2881355 RepID=UPI001E2BCB0D|nr:lytic polysaccharide monooxygenase [Glycomyces amatae]MCD0445551.1 lytic polysaccharide monooxygenase [Glycomyces amatae]
MSTTATAALGGRRRRIAAVMSLVLAAVAAMTITTLFTKNDAEAHGATVFPGSRQYFCYFDALSGNGALDPYNEACQDALAQSGPNAFYNWFGNLDSNGAGQTVGYIPDGQICDGGGRGPYDFSAFNEPGDWPRTHVTAGANVEWRYNNWAHHPGKFDLYITKDGWDPSQPIAWDDLELFKTISNPPSNGGPGSDDHYYYANLTLPQKSGYHVVFTHWVRSDSNENFYACSDVEFDGGNGEVSGLRPGANLPGNDGGVNNPDPDPTTPDDDDPTTGGPGEEPTGDCTATAAVTSWNGGATVNITVEAGADPISDWMIHWLWPPDSGIAITNSWGTTISSMGDMEMAGPAAWNGTISSNGSVTFGFNVTGNLTSMPEMDCIPG